MTTELEDRLRVLADHIDAELDADDDATVVRVAPENRRTDRRHVVVAVAVGLIALAGGLVVARSGQREPAPVAAPVTLPTDTPAPGSLLPHVPDPPAWLGNVRPGRRYGAERSGAWTTLAIARPAGDGYDAPIAVSAIEGTWAVLDDAVDVVVDGRLFRHARAGGVEVLATATTPMLVASGAVDQTVLADVLTAADLGIFDDGPGFRLDRLPDGYVLIVQPSRLADDPASRRTLVGAGGQLAISEVSDLVDPLLAAVMTGSDLRPVALGDLTGWTGTSVAHARSARFIIWSPQIGVVFEMDSTNDTHSMDRLVDTAAGTTVLGTRAWDAIYPA
ncbi:hypothetical protein BH18ACT2_BH18ACT2_22360 [soil metagenome]